MSGQARGVRELLDEFERRHIDWVTNQLGYIDRSEWDRLRADLEAIAEQQPPGVVAQVSGGGDS